IVRRGGADVLRRARGGLGALPDVPCSLGTLPCVPGDGARVLRRRGGETSGRLGRLRTLLRALRGAQQIAVLLPVVAALPGVLRLAEPAVVRLLRVAAGLRRALRLVEHARVGPLALLVVALRAVGGALRLAQEIILLVVLLLVGLLVLRLLLVGLLV